MTKVCIVKAMVFPVVMYRCESWTIKKAEPKNWCFWTVVLKESWESPLVCKEIKPVHPKENQPWVFIERTDAEAKAPILWPPDAKNWLVGKDLDAEKDRRQEEKGMTEDEMVRWHNQINRWVWANSGWWWRTRRSGMLQSMGWHRVKYDLATEKQQHKMLAWRPQLIIGYWLEASLGS